MGSAADQFSVDFFFVEKNISLKRLILPKNHFKTNLFFPIFAGGDPSSVRSFPWVGESTKQKIKIRDSAHQAAIHSKSVEDWARYKRLRNDLTKILQKEKGSWQQSKLIACEVNTDTAKLWKNVLGWLNWSSASSPTRLLHEGDTG